MLTRLRFAIVAVFVFPAFVVAQEKIMLRLEYPEGKYLYKMEQRDVYYDSFIRSLFDIRANPPRKLGLEGETITSFGPPDAEGIVRVDFEVTKYKGFEESQDDEDLLPEELEEKQQKRQLHFDNYSRAVLDAKIWMLVNPKLRQTLEVHGYDEIQDRVIETAAPEMREAYQSARKFFGDENAKKARQAGWRFYPDQPVAVGDQWTASAQIIEVPIVTKSELDIENTLKEIKTDSEGRRIAVIESHSEWKTDDPDKYGPYEIEYSQVEVYFDAVMELDIETCLEISGKRQIKVVAKRRIDYDVGSFLVVSVAKRTETSTVERIP